MSKKCCCKNNGSLPLSDFVFPLTAMEDNGSLSTGRMDLSLGNGNEHVGLNAGGWGFPVPTHPFNPALQLEIVALAFSSRTTVDGNGNTIELTMNTNPTASTNHVPTGFTVAIPPNSRIGQSTGSVIVPAGSVINFITINPGGTDLVVTPWARWT